MVTKISASVLVAVLLLGCSSTQTQFKESQNDDFEIDEDVEKDPTTVKGTNNGTTTGTNNGEVMIEGPGDAPDSFWIPATDDFVLKDDQTGSLWNLRGEAFEGPLAGLKLEQVPSFNSFWFAWSVFYHGSQIWNRDTDNQTADITQDGGECLVPCDEIRLGCGGGKDCIPALDYDGRDGRPVAQMVEADDPGADYLGPGSFVFGVAIDGEARAYPHNVFWWHEIYNDKIGDTEFSVTFCPLTGSGLVFDGTFGGSEVDFGVSGNLYNSNLVMFDRQSDTLWGQMIFTGVSGPNMGDKLTLLPVVETTWERWQEMYPDTLVASEDQGYSRNYNSYPYGDYRTDDSNTFRATNPAPDDLYANKDRVLGLPGESVQRAYAFPEMEEVGDRVVINDTYDGRKVVVVYEKEHRMALPFWAEVDGQSLTFEGARAP